MQAVRRRAPRAGRRRPPSWCGSVGGPQPTSIPGTRSRKRRWNGGPAEFGANRDEIRLSAQRAPAEAGGDERQVQAYLRSITHPEGGRHERRHHSTMLTGYRQISRLRVPRLPAPWSPRKRGWKNNIPARMSPIPGVVRRGRCWLPWVAGRKSLSSAGRSGRELPGCMTSPYRAR